MINPFAPTSFSPGAKRAFGSLLLAMLLCAGSGLLVAMAWSVIALVIWLVRTDPVLASVIATSGAGFVFVWLAIWSVMKTDGLFED